jgi:cytochrome P450
MPSALWRCSGSDSPVQLNVRVALEPVELFGETHPRGSTFVVLQGSGNHDETVYDQPATVRRHPLPDGGRTPRR